MEFVLAMASDEDFSGLTDATCGSDPSVLAGALAGTDFCDSDTGCRNPGAETENNRGVVDDEFVWPAQFQKDSASTHGSKDALFMSLTRVHPPNDIHVFMDTFLWTVRRRNRSESGISSTCLVQ